MQTIEYRHVDKSKWPVGPWTAEPDKRQWQDPQTSLPCLIVRNPRGGHLCGYVGVHEGHPAFGKNYDDVPVNVHGGLTFADFCSGDEHGICHKVEHGESDRVWWLGFDCAHSGDHSPGFDLDLRYGGYSYKSFDYVESEVASLARQLKEIQKRGRI